jgi:hypothetical protein
MMRQETIYSALYSFVVVMKDKLDESILKGKTGWRDFDVNWLWMRAQGELGELYAELMAPNPDPSKVSKEAADVANFMMMIADKVKEDHEQQRSEDRGGQPEDGSSSGDSEGGSGGEGGPTVS